MSCTAISESNPSDERGIAGSRRSAREPQHARGLCPQVALDHFRPRVDAGIAQPGERQPSATIGTPASRARPPAARRRTDRRRRPDTIPQTAASRPASRPPACLRCRSSSPSADKPVDVGIVPMPLSMSAPRPDFDGHTDFAPGAPVHAERMEPRCPPMPRQSVEKGIRGGVSAEQRRIEERRGRRAQDEEVDAAPSARCRCQAPSTFPARDARSAVTS